jgi:hypothetical protein
MSTKVSDLTALLGSDVVAGDILYIVDGTTSKKITVEELISAIVLLGVPLADIPAYADQAAAASALSGTGKLFRFNTTGALGITIT